MEQIAEGRDILLSKDEFASLVDISPIAAMDLTQFNFYFYEGVENIYVAYDKGKDIHYFFV